MRISIGIIAILSLISLILIIVLSTKSCDKPSCPAPPAVHQYTATLEFSNGPTPLSIDSFVLLTSKDTAVITKSVVSHKEVPVVDKKVTTTISSTIADSDIGQVDLLVKPTGSVSLRLASLTLKSQSEVKYCMDNPNEELHTGSLYTLTPCKTP